MEVRVRKLHVSELFVKSWLVTRSLPLRRLCHSHNALLQEVTVVALKAKVGVSLIV